MRYALDRCLIHQEFSIEFVDPLLEAVFLLEPMIFNLQVEVVRVSILNSECLIYPGTLSSVRE
jgi:hypothetical protein